MQLPEAVVKTQISKRFELANIFDICQDIYILKNMEEITVECYSGSRYGEKPIALIKKGKM